jgi:hypothetical protein
MVMCSNVFVSRHAYMMDGLQEKAAAVQERQRRKAEAKLKAKGDRAPTQTKVRHP